MHPRLDTLIVGAGLSGLVVGHGLRRSRPEQRILLLEKSPVCGGVIRSFSDNGYLAEYGPHGFLDNCAESKELLALTGLEEECVRASLQTFVRYVCIDGKLMPIPQSPLKIVRAPLIPWADKFRVAGEFFRKPLAGQPTVAKWAAHRFGRAVLPYVDAVFTGTYAGDYDELKIDAVMPGLRRLEHTHGSIIRGALAKARETARRRGQGKKLEMPAMTSFPEGMQRLPERLGELLGPDLIRCHCEVTRLRQGAGGWLVETGRETLEAANLVLALPVNRSLELLRHLERPPRAGIPEAWIATVMFGFDRGVLPPGFGYLNPEREGRFTLGTLFSSNMFPNRAPRGHLLFETLIGGRRHPERLDLDDDTIIREALADVRGLLDLPGTPCHVRVLRPSGGIPQLESGYLELLDWRNDLVRRHPGLYVCGFGWEGIGLNDMIRTASAVAATVATRDRQEQEEVEARKVYF